MSYVIAAPEMLSMLRAMLAPESLTADERR
ncbi:Uncharacterised protein [Mycobacterium tuberculosis]|nr:Uncharacterised protein [Mycobacterium tuberculosis]